jgi:hypothetical protein
MKIPYYLATLAFVLTTTPAMPSNVNRQWSRQSKDQWLRTCQQARNKPVRQGRVEIQRYGISVEIPAGMQLEMNESGAEVIIASSKSIATKSCIREAAVLHGQFIGGGNYAYIGITDGATTYCQESPSYCGKPMAISFLGDANTLYQGRDEYVNARNLFTGKRFSVYFHGISDQSVIMRFIRSARKSR